ncbi:MAG: 16S rRNA (uracil(1498)-N(3))-methyltransferase [Alphaproteobacteria bacterium]|nr:16S rRNA (uracil(1498)-N(3))-methyltransferase [Alphaproteobacteria bacterium]
MLRLYIPSLLALHQSAPLKEEQAHYALHVLRIKEGEIMRGYNDKDGEYEGILQKSSKRALFFLPITSIRLPLVLPKLGLAFGLIKNDRQGFLIEKAVELGVTDLFPMQTTFTQTSKMNPEKIHDQCVNASQQCERTDIPMIHPLQKIPACLDLTKHWSVHAAIERMEERTSKQLSIQSCLPPCLMIGPEGGWSDDEKELLLKHSVFPMDLGSLILRAETAAIVGLTMLKNYCDPKGHHAF